jgi:hypothetical protein
VTVERSRDAVLTDAAGEVLVNSFQDDCTGDPVSRAVRRRARHARAARRHRGRAAVQHRQVDGRARRRHRHLEGRLVTDDDQPSATLDATRDELAEIASQRTAATGHVVIVAGFTGSDQARVIHADPAAGRIVTDHGLVPLIHPSPGARDRAGQG